MAEEFRGFPVTTSSKVQDNKTGLLDISYPVTEEGRERRQQLFLLEGLVYSVSYHLILVGCPLKHALCPLDVEEDVGKDTDGILITPHHKVCEAHIVIGGHLALRHPGIHALRRKE